MRNSTEDVLSDRGRMTWERGMGLRACTLACTYILEKAAVAHHAVVDPFCGHGTVLATANLLGMHSTGVERNRGRCRIARNLRLGDEALRCSRKTSENTWVGTWDCVCAKLKGGTRSQAQDQALDGEEEDGADQASY